MKIAIITGVSGQDGAYLSKLLLDENYKVIGLSRTPNKDNIFWRLKKLKIYSKVNIIGYPKNII